MNQIEKGELPNDIVKTIAKKLEVNEKDVVEMNRRLSGPEKSLNTPISEEDKTEAIDMLRSNEDTQEKKLGQLFCDDSAQQIVSMLTEACMQAGVMIDTNARVRSVERQAENFVVQTDKESYSGQAVVVACGGSAVVVNVIGTI